MFNLRGKESESVKKVLFTYLNFKRLCRHTRVNDEKNGIKKNEHILIQNSILILDIQNRKEIQLNNSLSVLS